MTVTESKIILITGAGSGIGEATARHLAAAGQGRNAWVCWFRPRT